VARRGKHQYPGCYFRGLIEEPQVVPRRR
jgi:hypothetical protein